MIDPWTKILSNPNLSRVEKEVCQKASKGTPITLEPFLKRLLGTLPLQRQLSQSQLLSIANMWSATVYKALGRQIFQIDYEFGQSLLNTDVSEFSFFDLQLPFPAFYVALPPNFIMAENMGVLKDSRLSYSLEQEGLPSVEGILLHHPDITEEHLNPEGYPAKLALHCYAPTRNHRGAFYEDVILPRHSKFGDIYPDGIPKDVHLCIALLLYMSADNVQMEAEGLTTTRRENLERGLISASTTKQRNLLKRINRTKVRVTKLGTSPPKAKGSSPREATHGIRQHWVRGHFHHFWKGSHSEPEKRKLIRKWVAPHQRCVSNGDPAEQHVYRTDNL